MLEGWKQFLLEVLNHLSVAMLCCSVSEWISGIPAAEVTDSSEFTLEECSFRLSFKPLPPPQHPTHTHSRRRMLNGHRRRMEEVDLLSKGTRKCRYSLRLGHGKLQYDSLPSCEHLAASLSFSGGYIPFDSSVVGFLRG